ncbi:HNH/ENDO VII family nuclease [Neobacillus drentensis]
MNNLPKAYLTANREPFPTFFLSDEEKEREIEKSRSNQAKLQMIRREIQSSQRSLDNKMEQLWRLYDSKVKKFEIVDDQYQVKALKMKYKYTSIFEGMWDAIEDMSKDVFDLLRGVAVGLYSIVTGLATLVIDAGIVAVSSVIPDTIEPDFINKAANKRIDQYTEALVEAIKDPIGVVESISQSISDTYEEEGIMYVTGNAASSFIPIVGMATKLSKISKLTSKIPDSKPKSVSDTIKAKVDDLVKNNKVFEGFKKGTLQFVKGVKGGAVIFMDGVVGGMKKMVNPDHNIAYSTSGTLPWKVTNPKIVQDRIEDVVSQFAVKVESKGTGKSNLTNDIYKVTSKDVQQAIKGYEQTGKFTAQFKGFEVKAQRSLSHLSDKQLKFLFKKGYSPKDGANDTIILHHHVQKVEGPIIEIPNRYHDLGNKRQHPFGNKGGVGKGEERQQFDKWRKEYWKARYANELIKRGIIE